MTSYFVLSSLELVSLSHSQEKGKKSGQVVHLSGDLKQQSVKDSQSRETIRDAGCGRKSFTVRKSDSRHEVPAGYAPSVRQGLPDGGRARYSLRGPVCQIN